MQINGTLRHATRPLVTYDAEQQGESWLITVRAASQRHESRTWAPSPWRAIEQAVAEVLDGAGREAEAGKWDFNKKLDRPPTPKPLRRRGSLPPGSVPEWKAPET